MSDKICSVEGCKRKVKCKGVCPMHYHRLQRYGDPTFVKPRYARRGAMCRVKGCTKKATAQELCPKHYYRYRKYSDPEGSLPNWVRTREEHQRAYNTYNNMKSRCYNPKNKSYPNYGERGVKICDRWLKKPYGFRNFLEDMGDPPIGRSIDRIDVNGDYCPENCRWASRHEQSANRRNKREYTGVWKNTEGHWSARLIVGGVRYEQTANSQKEAISARKEMERRYL